MTDLTCPSQHPVVSYIECIELFYCHCCENCNSNSNYFRFGHTNIFYCSEFSAISTAPRTIHYQVSIHCEVYIQYEMQYWNF